jgi:hypothetical protein
MIEALYKAVFAIWISISPQLAARPSAAEIASAIAAEVLPVAEGRAHPVYASANVDLAAMAFGAFRESSLDAGVPGDCRDASNPETCAAHGPWQLHGPCGKKSIREQARCWMKMLRSSPCASHPVAVMWGRCSGPSPLGRVERLAAEREARVEALLDGIELPAVAPQLAPARLARVDAVPHSVVIAAAVYLEEGEPVGSERDVEVDGRSWVLSVEWHFHPEGFVDGPTGWHRGVTVYELRERTP